MRSGSWWAVAALAGAVGVATAAPSAHAQARPETTAQPVDRIGGAVGFGSPTAFRDRFKRVVGTSPQQYRRSFRR